MAVVNGNSGLWQKAFVALLSAVFVVLSGAYVKLAGDVATNNDTAAAALAIAGEALEATKDIRSRLDTMDAADDVAATEERNASTARISELERQQREAER